MDIVGVVNKNVVLQGYTNDNKAILVDVNTGKIKRYKIYNNSKGDYFNYNKLGIYIKDCIRKKNELYQDEKTICKKV